MKILFNNIKILFLKNIDLFIFIFLSVWNLVLSIRINRYYQDNWVLEDIWVYLFLLLGTYIFIVNRRSDLQQITILTFILTFLINALPALKYTYVYLSANDVASHLAFSASIAETGKLITNESYSFTPGFHVLSATISQISVLQIEIVEKTLPSLLGSFVPLCLYILCKRTAMPNDLAKWIIVLSSLSLPILYTLNGTSFTIPIFIFLLILMVLRIITPIENGFQYTLIALLLVLQIIIWHPSTSFVYPIYFITIGIFGFIFPHSGLLSIKVRSFLSIGLLAMVGTLSYWMYNANYVWSRFLQNVAVSVSIEKDASPYLIPARLFQISFADKAVIALLFHARDGILITIAILGLLCLAATKGTERYKLSIKSVAAIFISSIAILIGIFIINFGSQGYKRFLFYSVAISPIIAGYGLWKGCEYITKKFHVKQNLLFPLILFIIISISSLQIYPYQEIIPTLKDSSFNSQSSPILWIHQVNTDYQYKMLNYALKRLNTDDQMLTDYIGIRQVRIFFGLDSHRKLISWFYLKPQAAIILLHWPGIAGAYQEQIEFRSLDVINHWRTYDQMSTIYDNGYSFILYYPGNIQSIEFKK